MKKFLLLIMISISLFSCGYSSLDADKGAIVTMIEKKNSTTCFYYGIGTQSTSFSVNSAYFCINTVGAYNVGDIIKLTK